MKCIKYALVLMLGVSSLVSADEAQVRKSIKKALPAVVIDTVEKSEIEGILRVTTNNGEVLFVSDDGNHFIAGDLYAIKSDRIENISELNREKSRAEKVLGIAPDKKITFPAVGETKAKIAVFTDIDCGYCRKLHQEVPDMNKLGIEVSYLAYPRAGFGSDSYKKYVSAWCADDKLGAMTLAKNGKSIPSKNCDNPVDEQYHLGRAIGISGTPAIVLESGRLIPGYLSADKLGKALGIL